MPRAPAGGAGSARCGVVYGRHKNVPRRPFGAVSANDLCGVSGSHFSQSQDVKFYVFCFANLLEIYKFSTSGEIVTSCNISPLSVTDRGEIGMTFQVRAGVSCLFCGVGMVVGVDVCICVVVCVCVCACGVRLGCGDGG